MSSKHIANYSLLEIYDAASSIWYSNWARPPWSPSWPGRELWIRVTCSGGDGSGDKEDFCGDKPNQPKNPKCPPPKEGGEPNPGEKTDMEAISFPEESYSRILFCNKFFNDLPSLTEATDRAKSYPPILQDNLETWNNRARCFFHEITHLNYFMNAPEKSPVVEDVHIEYKIGGKWERIGAYGSYNVRVLRNYRGNAQYPAQNADTYAWYAMALWAKNEIGHYPPSA
jgi:hypothetical protein